MTMVERVALAISGGDDPASVLAIHRYRARAAIEAMRAPSDGMRSAGFFVDRTAAVDDIWQAMIADALE